MLWAKQNVLLPALSLFFVLIHLACFGNANFINWVEVCSHCFAKTNATGIPTIEMNRPAIWKIVAIDKEQTKGEVKNSDNYTERLP